MTELFDVGERIPVSRKRSRPTPEPIGSGPEGETCKTCRHAAALDYHDKRYYKCELIEQWTHGPGTDIRLKWAACAKWEVKQ